MKIRTLTIVEAWKLFNLIRDHFPSKLDQEVIVIDFISTFVDSIAKDSPTIIVEILRLLLEEDESKIIELSAKETLAILIEGFQANRVFDLYNFFQEIIK